MAKSTVPVQLYFEAKAPSPTVGRRLSLYCDLMEEIKERFNALSTLFGKDTSRLFSQNEIGEFCHLQLRIICELIALGAMVAHGDIAATRGGKLPKKYEADGIVRALAKIHPRFYPRPARVAGVRPNGMTMLRPITKGYLTKTELPFLYGECGKALHRGTARTILAGQPRTWDFKRIAEWAGKIQTLLERHHISLLSSSEEYWITMNHPPKMNVVAVHVALVPPPA